LTVLGLGLGALAYVAMTEDVLAEGRDKRRVYVSNSILACSYIDPMIRGAYAAVASFLLFSMVQFRDGPFIRPHPVFWRAVLGVNVLYELALVFLLFQDLDSARHMMTYIDPSLGKPLPEKSYGENCAFTWSNVWVCVNAPLCDEPTLSSIC
jgi:phosphatidylserine synthase 2